MIMIVGWLLAAATIVAAATVAINASAHRRRAAELAKAAELIDEHTRSLEACLDTPGVEDWLSKAFLSLSDAFEDKKLMAEAIHLSSVRRKNHSGLDVIELAIDELTRSDPSIRKNYDSMIYSGIMGNVLADEDLAEMLHLEGILIEMDIRRRALQAASQVTEVPIDLIDKRDGLALA